MKETIIEMYTKIKSIPQENVSQISYGNAGLVGVERRYIA
jgi:hypothetical protein